MLDKLRDLLHKVDKVDDVVKEAPKAVVSDVNAVANAVKDEIQEVKDLNLTEADKLLGDTIATLSIMVMQTYGIPCSDVQKQIIAKAAAYGIRDFKEGCTNPDKLIVMRICNKIQEEREARAAARKANK